MEKPEFDHSIAFNVVETLDYIPHSVLVRTIIKKPAGNISAVSVDADETMAESTSPFDTFIHAIDGKGEIVINGIAHSLETGQSIIIPAHSRNTIKATVQFKMLSAIFKSGYEE
jgi:quercetin dioxygenase-like cupin family protein